jgi:hypothetical protein
MTEFRIYKCDTFRLVFCSDTEQISAVSYRTVQVNIKEVDKMMNETPKPVQSLARGGLRRFGGRSTVTRISESSVPSSLRGWRQI